MYIKCISRFIILAFIMSSCSTSNNIQGNWVSENPEKNATGSFGIRQFSIKKETWQVQAMVYADSFLQHPLFTFRATGKYNIGRRSVIVNNAHDAVFNFEKKYLMLQTIDTSIIKKLGLDKCLLIYAQEKDITAAGCSYFASKAVCAQEFDLVATSGNRLFLGARPASGGMCDSSKRPTVLGLPLKKIPG